MPRAHWIVQSFWTRGARLFHGRLKGCLRSPKTWALMAGVLLAPVVGLLALALVTPLPPVLADDHSHDSSIRILDRHGRSMAEVRADDGARARWVKLDQVQQHLVHALLAAEDKRYYWHPGIDPLAVMRAAGQNLCSRRIVSGASTLTQQLARNVVPRPRTMLGKVKEAAVAIRIEMSLSKQQILEQYLNLVSFGPSLRGVEAAARFYFDKPAASLSLAESATLAAMPRGPVMYDPRRAPRLLQQRRDEILDRMQELEWASAEQVLRAKKEPLTVHARPTGWSAPHLIHGLLQGQIDTRLGPLAGRVSVLHTTLDARLQREVQTAARATVHALRDRHVSAASVVVLDNGTGQVLAWVGAHDYFDDAALGKNDGVLAKRQPGSSLKPFVFSVAMDDLGWSPATLLPDIELHVASSEGAYAPRNYDGRFHGPVRLREALANSYNIPAVYTAAVVGPGRVLERLRALGFDSLQKEASYYGAAIALGDGEVRLIELARAYATLARGGLTVTPQTLLEVKDTRGQSLELPLPPPSDRVMPQSTAALILDILADPKARLAAFGPDSVLELPFPVAAKTGTSKAFRDNVAVGCTREVTVAVWVGNFDGSPMQGVSGITGAGPLFRAAMLAAMESRKPAPLYDRTDDLEQAEVCALSGKRPGPHCSHRMIERFVKGQAPDQSCDMHVLKNIDTRNGLLAGDSCPPSASREQVFERYEPRYSAWAATARRPTEPLNWSPLCLGAEAAQAAGTRLAVRYPYDGAVFLMDPSLEPSSQSLVLRAEAPASVRTVQFVLDGRVVGTEGLPFERAVPLSPGQHRVWVEAQGRRSEPVVFEVR